MKRPYTVVDVFSEVPLRGNPVAVVHAAQGLSDAQMQAYASWTNLSETTFLLPPSDARADYRLRIFTPSRELPFAGHPTLGSCHAWTEAGGAARDAAEVVQQCAVGLVRIRRQGQGQGQGQRLAFAAPACVRSGPLDGALVLRIAAVLRIAPGDIVDHQWVDNGPGWCAVRLASADAVLALRPAWPALAGLMLGVIGAYPADRPEAFEVRALIGEGAGYEDPVTGSLNASMAQWLTSAGAGANPAPASYRVSQGRCLQRAGQVHIDVVNGQVWVGGASVSVVRGEVDLDRVPG